MRVLVEPARSASPPTPLRGRLRGRGAPGLEAAAPLGARGLALRDRLAEVVSRRRRDEEVRVGVPAERLLGGADLGLAERRAVRRRGAGLLGRAEADGRLG